MLPDAVQRVAEDYSLAQMGVKERPHSKMIASAKQPVLGSVPNGECKITEEVLDTVFTPRPIGAEKQLAVCQSTLHVFAPGGEFLNQVALGIQPRVRDDPHMSVKRKGLTLVSGFFRGPKQRVA